jgi:hypothetical protein
MASQAANQIICTASAEVMNKAQACINTSTELNKSKTN